MKKHPRPTPQATAAKLNDAALPAMARLMVGAGLALLCLALLCRLVPLSAASSAADLLAIACSGLVFLAGSAYLLVRRRFDRQHLEK